MFWGSLGTLGFEGSRVFGGFGGFGGFAVFRVPGLRCCPQDIGHAAFPLSSA